MKPRTPSKLSDSLHHQLNMYALAASAAGVGMLALAQSAEAKIVYTPAHVKLGTGGIRSYSLCLNHVHKTDFVLLQTFSSPGTTEGSLLEANGVKENGVVNHSGKFASALPSGSQIGPQQKFANAGLMVAQWALVWTAITYTSGPWANVKNRYLGLKFQIKGRVHYGWARMSVRVMKGKGISALLTGYAYETTANKPIIAGKTKGPDVVTVQEDTVQPGSLGRLALGTR